MKDALIDLLALLPVPYAPVAARTIKALMVEARRKDNSTADVSDIEAMVDGAVAEALDPCRRIQACAAAELAGR